MAECPNCGKKLRLTDWKPDCPNCGVNMIYYNANERLLAETEAAEIQHAHFQPSIDRALSSTINSPIVIIRLVMSLFLPVGSLFLPLFVLDDGSKVNVIKIFGIIKEKSFGGIISSAPSGGVPLGILLLLLSVVMLLVSLFALMASLGRHGKIRNLINDLVWLGLVAGGGISFITADISECFPDASRAKPGIGFFVYMGLILAVTVLNLILAKKGVKQKHTVCLIGGLPSDEYFKMVEDGVDEIEIRKKMVVALEKMQEEAREKARQEEEARQAELAKRR